MALQFLSAVEIPQLSHLERKRQIKDGPDYCNPNNVTMFSTGTEEKCLSAQKS